MIKRRLAIKVISYALALLYAVSFFYYLSGAVRESIFHYSSILGLMFLVLFFGAIALAFGKKWGRDILIGGNVVFFIVGMWMLMLFPNLVQIAAFSETAFFHSILIGGIFMALVIAGYLAQAQVRMALDPEWKFSRKSILVVDDDDGIQATLKRILLDRGYSVLSALNGERGLQIARTQQPDLILLDVILPGMKGRAVCAKLKEDEATKHIPVIFLTAKDSPDDIEAERKVGGLAHMTKPIKTRVLLSEIKRVLS